MFLLLRSSVNVSVVPIFWPLSIPDESYSRNASCALVWYQISHFYIIILHVLCPFPGFCFNGGGGAVDAIRHGVATGVEAQTRPNNHSSTEIPIVIVRILPKFQLEQVFLFVIGLCACVCVERGAYDTPTPLFAYVYICDIFYFMLDDIAILFFVYFPLLWLFFH